MCTGSWVTGPDLWLDSIVTSTMPRPPLVRPRSAVVGGVCAGLAAHLGWPVRRVRLIMVVAAFLMGAGVLLYLWLWALTPVEETAGVEPVRRSFATSALLLVAGAFAAMVAVASANAD